MKTQADELRLRKRNAANRRRNNTAKTRMLLSEKCKEFYRHRCRHYKSPDIYVYWLEKGMHLLGHRKPETFLRERTVHGLVIQLAALKVAAAKKCADKRYAGNIVSAFKSYVDWQKAAA